MSATTLNTTDRPGWETYIEEEPRGHPIEKEHRVVVVEHIKHNATGEVRKRKTWMVWWPEDGDQSPGDYMYSEGNYSCDCNRHLFFHRANDVEPEDDRPCGDEAYSLNLENPKTGEIFYREFE